MFGAQIESFEDTVNNRMNHISSYAGDVTDNVIVRSRTSIQSPSTWRNVRVDSSSYIERNSDARLSSTEQTRGIYRGRYDTVAVDSRYFYVTRNGMPDGSVYNVGQTSTTMEPLKIGMVADLEVSTTTQPLL